MLNIEKYKDEILSKKEKLSIGCASAEIAGLCCDVLKCPECRKKTMKWLTSEYKEPILTEKEKAYLKAVIKPKRDEVTVIRKRCVCEGLENEYSSVSIYTKHPTVAGNFFAFFDFVITEDMPFEGMELEKEYTLEELGL